MVRKEAGADRRLLALKMEEGSASQGKWAPPEAGKDQETNFPHPDSPEGRLLMQNTYLTEGQGKTFAVFKWPE